MIKHLLVIIIYLPLGAFFLNMFLVAGLGRELAIELNNGTVSTTTFAYSYITLVFLFLLIKLRK
jgi:Na+/H+-dicarboxylate symporter